MVEFFSDLKSILSLSTLKSMGRKLWDDDCLGLAGQLAYFILLSLFPFLMFLVAVASIVVNDPESALKTLTERMEGFLPQDAVRLLVGYVDRTLRSTGSEVLLFGILAALSSGSAAASAIIKATNRAYELRETRPFWKIQGISILMVLGLALLIVALALAVFGPGVAGYVQRLTGLPNVFLSVWRILRWGVAFLAVTFALDILYYVAPNVDLPFKWITPGGVVATVLTLISSVALKLYVANFGRYDQVYGHLGAVIVLMLWLYITGLMVLVGAEMNAVIARRAEKRLGIELIQAGTPTDRSDA